MLTRNWKLTKGSIPFVIAFILLNLLPVHPLTAQTSNLDALRVRLADKYAGQRGPVYQQLKNQTSGPMGNLNQSTDRELIGVDERGFPRFYTILNLNSAYTTRTNELWPLGDSDLDLTGVSTLLTQFGLWDRGGVLLTHVEFDGRAVQMDDADEISAHSTHVAGTMASAGENYHARGMAPESPLMCFDWTDDFTEIVDAAENGMIISNHSYGEVVGWAYSMADSDWYWFGDPEISEVEDYQFGYYSDISYDVDDIAYNAPYLLMCWAGGNDRLEGPMSGTGHWVWNGDDWEWSEVERNRDGNDFGYDTMSHMALAKNILSVEAVATIPEGYEDPNDVLTTSFSSKGPTDDGRIKPDLVVPGLNIVSTGADSDNDYNSGSGSSSASPAVAGIANLLQEHYKQTHGGELMKASTVKAVLLNSTEEAGSNDGPDYTFGYGLVNSEKAADIITKDVTNNGRIFERILNDQTTDSIFFYYSGRGEVRATIAWNDPPGLVTDPALNDPTPDLVNDLDLRLVRLSSNTEYEPWCLNPAEIYMAATTGDNHRDNVEQVLVPEPEEGPFCVIVSHKESLQGGGQEYSLAVTGMDYSWDNYFPHPKFLSASVIPWTGVINLSWAHALDTPDNLEMLVYDDGSPDGHTSSVGNLHASHFSVNGTCEVLEVQLFTVGSLTDREFYMEMYNWLGDHPGLYRHAERRIRFANLGGWNEISFEDNPITLDGDFMVGFKTNDINIALGKDDTNSGETWLLGGTSWTQGTGTLFIRALVRYEDGSTEYVGSNRPQLDELDEFQHYRIWKNGELIDTCTTLTYQDVLTDEGIYNYWVDAIYSDGRSVRSNVLEVDWAGVSVDENNNDLPGEFMVSKGWPNPFNPEVSFSISLPEKTDISVSVYDITGRFVANIHRGELSSGTHQFSWKPEKMAAGTYFLSVRDQKNFHNVQKVVYLK